MKFKIKNLNPHLPHNNFFFKEILNKAKIKCQIFIGSSLQEFQCDQKTEKQSRPFAFTESLPTIADLKKQHSIPIT